MSPYVLPSFPIYQFHSVDWKNFALLGTKTQKRDLHRVIPWFALQGIQPSTLSQAVLDQAYRTKLSGFDHKHNQDHLRHILNTFVTVFNNIIVDYFTLSPILTKIAGPQDQERQAKEAFRGRFASCLIAYSEARAKEFGLDSYKIRRTEENGLFNSVRAASEKGITISVLNDLLQGRTITLIMDWCDDEELEGRSLEMMNTLACLASQSKLWRARRRFLEKAGTLRHEYQLSANKLRLLAEYVGEDKFSGLVKFFQTIISEGQDFDVRDIRSSTPYISAVAALILVFAPTTLEFLLAAKFTGEPRRGLFGDRPTLALCDGCDSMEDPLSEGLNRCIDVIYERYRTQFPDPVSLFLDVEGEVRDRKLIVDSIEILLNKSQTCLTIHDLRDIGVTQMICAGDSDLTISAATRLSVQAVETRFKTLKEAIKIIKKRAKK